MDVLKCIRTRRSIREYKNKNIDKDDLYLLIEAGMHAPTAGNLQDIRYVVTVDEKLITKIANACMEQDWIQFAKGIIIICSQPELVKEWYGEKGDSIFAVQNAAMAAQNILLAAHDIGLGACFVSGFNTDEMNKIMDTGKKARVEIVIPIGYPDETPDDKTMEEFDGIVFYNKYGNDKENKLLINKDYSAIVERELKRGQEKVEKSWHKKIKPALNEKISKLKENLNKKKD